MWKLTDSERGDSEAGLDLRWPDSEARLGGELEELEIRGTGLLLTLTRRSRNQTGVRE